MQELEGERKTERLTQWVDDGEKRFAIPRVDIRNIGHQKCCTRLAEYEDTGMTPEEIHQMKTELAVARAVANLCRAEKPELYSDGYDKDGNLIYDEWECPRCGESYEVDYDRYDYCPNCGQKIDWSDENE